MTDALDEARLHAAFNDGIARHAILRTADGVDTAGESRQLLPDDQQISWRTADLADLTEEDRQRRIKALARAEFEKPFDLTNELPLRVTLIRTGTDESVLLLVVHHLSWDDEYWANFFSELSAAYRGHQVTGDAPKLFALKVFEAATESAVADGGHGADTSRVSREPLELSRNHRVATITPPAFDIAFIGSGIACSMTLLELAQTLLSPGSTPPKLRIAVVERDEQFWCGIPYGQRSSARSLAIQKLDDFVVEPERSAYIAWLERNKSRWLASFQEQGGEAAACWIRDNREALDANRWGGLYLPRYVFGVFIAEQLHAAIADLGARDLAEIVTIHAEAISARSAHGRHLVGLRPSGEGPTEIEAGKVVVAIGSPAAKSIVGCDSDPAFTYINDFYSPREEISLERLRESLDRIEPREKRNVLVVGSNATSLEALYLMRHDARIRERVHSITVISRSGMLPYKICDEPPEFEFPRLNALLSEETVGAADLMSAIRADLGTAEERSLNLADLYDAIGVLLGQALAKMELAQQEEFYCVHGMNFTKLVRRAGRDCREASEELATDGTLCMLAGEVLRVDACPSGEPFATMKYRAAGAEHVHPVPFAAVVNCGGFEELDACSSPFLVSAMQNGLCRPNRTNRGLFVNNDFEASPDFCVIGPLVGGNFNAKIRLWHVESAPRIRSLAKSLAASLVASLPPTSQTVSGQVVSGMQVPAVSLVRASMVPDPVFASEGELGA
jgi:uncharacterized NAD(P)/FAD-binding protein YdhS